MRFHRQGISAIIGVLLIVLLGFCWKLSGSYGIVSTALPHNQSAIKSTDLPSIRWDNYHEFVRDIDFDNSTAIFNSIRAALRQSPSDIHPVGVSYFPAVIPKGTLMYHAGSKVPTTFEWLAMDHEFSYSFGLRSPSYGRKSLERRHGRFGNGTDGDHPKGPPPPPPPPDEKGRGSQKMLTYRAARDLNKFLYLDGASAAKTDSGEMDTQLMLSNVIKEKLNLTDDGENERMAERLYAARICKWGKPFGLDGIIRVEVGFEVVLCDFSADNVELVSMLEMVQPNQYLGLPAPTVISKEEGWPLDENGSLVEDQLTDDQKAILEREDGWEKAFSNFNAVKSFNQLRAGAAHDNGEHRIHIDYRYLVSGINRTYIAPDPNNRRLLDEGMTWEKQLDMVDDLEKALEVGFDATQSMDWQLAFDELVLKFAPLLKSVSNILNSDGDINESIAINATALTLNFYFLIWSSAVSVVGEIVDVIYKVNDLLIPEVYSFMTDNTTSSDLIKNVETARSTIDGLIESLGWIELNYRCERQCNWDEVCYTPSWGPSPMGMTEPGSHNEGFGTHFDESRQRLVINSKLQCININDLMVNRNH
ncbi:AIS_HP2_G0041030.mRNA.1.CDS.1 [Saccharomyces cerevisiae]|nr:AIS_HP2_G0041030.mRNA.1.CDS.1 [Saccharomyces cerevisiae]CAI6701141.1 AIS_HP2_G0041030.mRNA.1.CDS.1 [Saccharomyces cerevisiae]